MELGQNEETCVFKYVWKKAKQPTGPQQSKWELRSALKLSLIYIQHLLGAFGVFLLVIFAF